MDNFQESEWQPMCVTVAIVTAVTTVTIVTLLMTVMSVTPWSTLTTVTALKTVFNNCHDFDISMYCPKIKTMKEYKNILIYFE
jgi:hypothetical protein